MFVDKKEIVEEIHDVTELKKHLKPLYIITDYMESDDKYTEFQESIFTLLKGCIEKKECREYPVKFKFYVKDKKSHTLQLRHFLVNLFIWHPFVTLYGIEGVLNEDSILDCFTQINDPDLNNFINEKVILVLGDYAVKNTTRNYCLSTLTYNLRRISIEFSQIMSLTLNVEEFLQVYENNDRMKQIMETRFPLDMQPADIEAELGKIQEEEIAIFKSMKNSVVGTILRAGSGMKHKSLCLSVVRHLENLSNCWKISCRQSAAKLVYN